MFAAQLSLKFYRMGRAVNSLTTTSAWHCQLSPKNITEANASYSAEVCLYAIFVTNWLHNEGKAFLDKFFVSDRIYLWRHIEMPTFTKVLGTKEGGDHANRLEALRHDLE